MVQHIGSDLALSDAQVARWAGFTDAYSAISDLVDRFVRMIAIADRLDVLADGHPAEAL